MNKEEKYSFIIEFDEMTDKQMNNLTDCFNNNEIKFHVLKSNYELKKQKEVIDETINAIDLVIELIKQQPTKDDRWILDRLNGFKIILEDKEVSE